MRSSAGAGAVSCRSIAEQCSVPSAEHSTHHGQGVRLSWRQGGGQAGVTSLQGGRGAGEEQYDDLTSSPGTGAGGVVVTPASSTFRTVKMTLFVQAKLHAKNR